MSPRNNKMTNTPIRILHAGNGFILLASQSPPSLKQFSVAAKAIPGTYAQTLVERFFTYLCDRAIDVRQEYDIYYKPEYSSILAYMFHKYVFPPAIVDALKPLVEHEYYIGLVRHDRGGDFQMENFIKYCETGCKVLSSAIGIQWDQTPWEDNSED